MQRYATQNRECRRRVLLSYFDEEPDFDSCNGCDVCTKVWRLDGGTRM